MRERIWQWVSADLSIGMLLPRWALVIRSVLYPLDSFYWYMSKSRGYDWQTDTWRIEGVVYSGEAMRRLAQANGEVYRIKRVGNVLMLKCVYEQATEGRKLYEPVQAQAMSNMHAWPRERPEPSL